MAKYGYYQPYFIVGAAITVVSGGLTYTLNIDTSIGRQVGYQILMGFGTGLVLQIPPIIAGIVTSNADKAVGLAAVLSELRFHLLFQSPTTNIP
jgi:MFS transporter, DHA2 family, glioxin efflux transporter